MKLRQLFLPAIAATLLVSSKSSYSEQPDGIVTTEGRLGDLLAAKELTSATRLVIAGSLNYADFGALQQMPNLTHLDISQTTVTDIPEQAFGRCGNLETIELPNNLKSIGKNAFSDCSSLTSIVIPESVTSIGEWAFDDCDALTSIIIPDGVTEIGRGAFLACSALISITVLPNNTTYKDIDGVLYSKDGKTLFAYPAGKTATSYVIQSGVTLIAGRAFWLCDSLTSIIIPEGVTSIGREAFYSCSSLTSIVIPEGVTSIGGAAFLYCSSLTSIVIPEGVTSIGEAAFLGCSSLTSIVIPEGVTSIGQWAFSYCIALTAVVVPAGVTSIGDWAFSDCSSLRKVTCLATTPPELDLAVFDSIDEVTRELAVPVGSVKAYENDEDWRSYFKHIKAIKPNKRQWK